MEGFVGVIQIVETVVSFGSLSVRPLKAHSTFQLFVLYGYYLHEWAQRLALPCTLCVHA